MSKTRVLFEAGPIFGNQKTGVGYYASQLARSIQDNYPDELEITGYYFNFMGRKNIRKNTIFKYIYVIKIVPGKLLSLSRRLGFQPYLELFINKKSSAIIFTNYVSLPMLRKRKVFLVVYDLGFLDVPQYIHDRNLKFLQHFCNDSILKADVIITISNFTKERIEYYFPNITAKILITPIPPSLNQSISSPYKKLSKTLENKKIKSKKYILYLGTIEPRKNLEQLIIAYTLLGDDILKEYSLVLAGGKGWKDESILSLVTKYKKMGIKIILTGYISDDEKIALFSNASCFILASHYEGFGMPILEAMQYKLPIAVSDIPVFHEVAEDGALFFNKDNPLDIAEKIKILLYDSHCRENLIEKQGKILGKNSWEKNADIVFKEIKN
jgi:glycosyltransferase involved in cell wall biosynthesis